MDLLNRGKMKLIAYALLAINLALTANIAGAADYPEHPIKIIVPNPPGGSADIVARILGEHLSNVWKQAIVVENRPGGNTAIGTTHVARSTPDGYTLLLAAPSFPTFKVLFKQPGFDVEKDFALISQIMSSPLVLAVNAALPVHSLSEFIAYAKKNPGKLNYGTFAAGQLLDTELFRKAADIDLFR